ncbi:MAG: hypothetical protein HY961_06240 [Ignavibacteriae bacterium]|nr:hypothetical protein [Ignavibacteriota bacterium]
MNKLAAIVTLVVLSLRCADQGTTPPPTTPTTDAELFALVTAKQPYATYPLFPLVDSVTSGTLNGSTAHQPLVRVRMNRVALGALRNGRLPTGLAFPDSSIIFKEILSGGTTQLFAVLYKDSKNPLAGNGWLWAEYSPNGNVLFSIDRRGVGCIACHSREQGPQHDFIRTFERQR